jgi:uncharacterized protein YkwD
MVHIATSILMPMLRPSVKLLGLVVSASVTLGSCAGALIARSASRHDFHSDLDNSRELNYQLLQRVNQVRRRGHRCGNKWYPEAGELAISDALIEAAERHADDMAAHHYLEHEADDGSTPSQRVARTGYRSRLTGENIAFAPTSVDEVFDGWLASPGHCENMMNPRFRATGAAVAVSRAHGHPHYWVQLLAAPR